jgi:chromosomal replication initiation ATPase DnaA
MSATPQANPELEAAIDDGFRQLAIEFVMTKYEMSIDLLQSKRRSHELAEARALLVWIAKTYRPQISYPTIGRWLGGMNHSSLIEAHQRANEALQKSRSFARHCEEFAQIMRHRMEVPHGCA